jgi:hypothetical protein
MSTYVFEDGCLNYDYENGTFDDCFLAARRSYAVPPNFTPKSGVKEQPNPLTKGENCDKIL